MGISEFRKPRGQWCTHCAPGKGCKIYDTRPATCRDFVCGWLMWPELGPEWKPEICKVIAYREAEGRRLSLDVDPGFPSAWRSPAIYRQLKAWAVAGSPTASRAMQFLVTVKVGRRTIVVLPDRDVDLGNFDDDEVISISAKLSPGGMSLDVAKVKAERPAGAG